MATYTTNYNLKKLALTDSPPDITELNGNFDTIDETMHSLAGDISANTTDIGGKMPKATTATTGNIAKFDANGNCVDGGLSFSVVNGVLRVTYPD